MSQLRIPITVALAAGLAALAGATTQLSASAAPMGTTPAGPWTKSTFPVPEGKPGTAQLAFSRGGSGVVDWSVDPVKAGGAWRTGIAATHRDGSLRKVTIVPWTAVTAPALDSVGRAFLLAADRKQNSYDASDLSVVQTGIDGAVGPRHPLTTGTLEANQDPVLRVDAKGDAIAAWVEQTKGGPAIRYALRPFGKPFGKAITLFGGRGDEASAVSTAIDASGHVALAFAGRIAGRKAISRSLYVATGSARGRALGHLKVAGPQDGTAHTAAAFTRSHRLDVAWGSQASGEEAETPWVIRAASLRKGATSFGKVQVVDPGSVKEKPQGGLQLVAGPGNSSVLAWNAVDGTYSDSVKVATSNPYGVFSGEQTLDAHAVLGGLAVRDDGQAVVTFTPNADGPGTSVRAATRLPGGAFAPAATVSPVAVDDQWYSEPLGALKPAPAFSPTLVGQQPRMAIALIEQGAGGKPQLVFFSHWA